MNYAETLDFLFSQLPMYQRVGPVAYKKDLGNTLALCAYLNNPEKKFRSIHIAGTNGKGSTSHMIASVLQTQGYKTGLYTSPHLIDFRERIRINGTEVSEQFVVDFVERIKPALDTIKPSFFEITVAMAFAYFAESDVDIAVIETGLGGRLDSTNVITPEICLITNIGLDHTDMLGDTLPEIAAEKAGIIKEGIPVVIGEYNESTAPVFERKAKEVHAPLYYANDLVPEQQIEKTDLSGAYQSKNVRSVMATLHVLKQCGRQIDDLSIRNGLLNVASRTGLKGRWQTLGSSPKIICDTGHNTEGITEIVAQLERESFRHLHIVFGQVGGKDSKKVLSLLPKHAHYYFCQPGVIRALPVSELMPLAENAGLSGHAYESVIQAYVAARAMAAPDDLIFIGGSTFVVADLLSALQNEQMELDA